MGGLGGEVEAEEKRGTERRSERVVSGGGLLRSDSI